mmetsp:Transcript_14406/g.36600  ORF Transcript_14406/g.36600 Transcript_14406/m.36600 type:complete len:203 (+) Transcript_14406:255-863(+)|eukprot:5698933-Prymnesium_polylepis.1
MIFGPIGADSEEYFFCPPGSNRAGQSASIGLSNQRKANGRLERHACRVQEEKALQAQHVGVRAPKRQLLPLGLGCTLHGLLGLACSDHDAAREHQQRDRASGAHNTVNERLARVQRWEPHEEIRQVGERHLLRRSHARPWQRHNQAEGHSGRFGAENNGDFRCGRLLLWVRTPPGCAILSGGITTAPLLEQWCPESRTSRRE